VLKKSEFQLQIPPDIPHYRMHLN